MAAELHLAENSLALHLLLQRLEGLIDIVIANENLHAASSFIDRIVILIKQRGRQKTVPLTLSARMYQTKPPMSTCGRENFVPEKAPIARDIWAKVWLPAFSTPLTCLA